MEIWEWLSSARKIYTQKSPLSSSRALPMSPGVPASKLLVLALSKATLTIVFILWKVFASSFSPPCLQLLPCSFRHHPTCREDQGDEASIGERPGLDSSPLYLLQVFCGLQDDMER